MKNIFLTSALILFAMVVFSQNVGINDDGSQPDASAILDVKSTSKGILIPRMTQLQRTGITSPATGLMVYQTDNTAGFWYYNGTAWQSVGSSCTESDPVFSASAASGITGSDVTNWNSAYSWGQGWSITGNAGTNPATQFIGTTDNVPLVFRTNNLERMRITTDGNIGIGTSNPTQKLNVYGSISIRLSENATDRFELHVNRGMINFGTLPGDDHLVIYNNNNNIDNEGAWDGMKMNVYQGLNVRVGDHGSTSALYISASGNTGIGNTSPQRRLEVAATNGSWISGTFSGTGGTDKIVMGNLNNHATIGAHDADFTSWKTLGLNTDGVSVGGDVIMGINSKVGIGTASPATSAILDISSTNKGFLPPRMTQLQREAIESPAQGLLVYQTNATSGLYYYTGSEWQLVNEPRTETDPVYIAAPAGSITDNNISDWNTAYSWGDHSSAGYLTSYTETDPIFGASASAGITSTNINNWNTAYGWGNHASAGYLTSYTETDPVFVAAPANTISAGNISNWNTAYGWGQGWALAGNSGTNPATQFIGTTDLAGLAFRTNNTEQIRITPTGNVGIGTSSPTQKLDVRGNIIIRQSVNSSDFNEMNVNRGRLKFSSEDDNNHLIYNNFRNIDGEGLWDGIKMNVYQGLNVRVGDGGSTSALFINSSGNVGIGTTNPQKRLDVSAGDSWISGVFSGNGGSDRVVIGNFNNLATIGAHNNSFTSWETLGVNTTVTGGGNVIMAIGSQAGIGTSSPDASAILDVSSTSKGFLPPRMTAAQRSAIVSPATGLTVYQTDETSGLYYHDGISWNQVPKTNSESDPVFLASPSGSIGNTDVSNWNSAYSWGNHAAAGYLTDYTETDPVFMASAAAGITNTNISNWNSAYGFGQGWKLTGNSGTNPASNFLGTADNTDFSIGTNNSIRLRISSNGNVGIGTDTPAQKLDVQGNVAIKASTGASNKYELLVSRGRINFSSVANDNNHCMYNNLNNIDGEGAWDGLKMNVYNGLMVRVGNNGAWPALYVGSDGNVGIGTTSPTQKLEIAGSMILGATSVGYYNDINVNRGRLKFSSENDNNHVIYNNYANIDGEGIWDGLKMNVYAGLNIRTGNNGATSALYINSDGNVGINTTSPAYKLTVNGSVALKETGSSPTYYTVLTAGDQSQNITYTLPTAYPTNNNQFLTANTSGVMSWATPPDDQTLAEVLAQGTDAGNLQIVNIANQAIGTATPNASAAFEVNSTTRGVLLPRLTEVQIAAVASPAEGLMVYNTTAKELAYYNGTSWFNMDDVFIFQVGDRYQGGYIFYIDGTGHHGLICADIDQATTDWGCLGTDLPGAAGTAIGTGYQNTQDIIAGCATAGIAARVCNDLILNGYSDWYMPSKDEMGLMYTNLKTQGIGNFANAWYWTSSESDATYAWVKNMGDGLTNEGTKSGYPKPVRAIRAF